MAHRDRDDDVPPVRAGRSPDRPELERLVRRAGVRAFLCLNEEGEADLPLAPNVEASWAHTFGATHARASLPRYGLPRPDAIDRALAALAGLPRPVLVHSADGRRAAAVLAIHEALERGLADRGAEARARELGVEPGDGWLGLVGREVERRRTRATTPPPASGAGVGP